MSGDLIATIVGAAISAGGFVLVLYAPTFYSKTSANDRSMNARGAMPTNDDLKGARDLDVETWSESAERATYIKHRGFIYATAWGGGLVAVGGILLATAYRTEPYLLGSGAGGHFTHVSGLLLMAFGIMIVAYSGMPYLTSRSAYRHRRSATASALVNRAIKRACSGGASALELPQLFELNRRQLDEYQQITRKQQGSTFLLAQIASVVAFLVLVAGIVTALAAHDDVEKYLSGGLSALGTALSAFLAKTFFQAHQDANAQMNRYYLEPQRTGRLLAAERAISKIATADAKPLLAEIVQSVLSWEMPVEGEHEPADDEASLGSTKTTSVPSNGAMASSNS